MSNYEEKYYYLIHIRFLGFRYSGWQKQVNAKTIQGMIDKTFYCMFEHEDFKTLGAGRTDSKVSANKYAFELFLNEKKNEDELLKELNLNLPPDIRAISVKEVSHQFNIINDSKLKEYLYIFSNVENMHPFSASLMVNFPGNLDIALMKKGAALFQGAHNFQKYCYKPNPDTNFEREIIHSEIIENKIYTANFFPETTWIYKVQGKGFMRQQIRLMLGTLVKLGLGEISLGDIEDSLTGGDNIHLGFIAPSSGLMLNNISFD